PFPPYTPFGSSLFAAVTLTLAAIRTDRKAVGTEASLGLHAPVGGGVVRIVELRFFRIRRGQNVHPLVPKVQAMDADDDFRGSEMLHKLILESGDLVIG